MDVNKIYLSKVQALAMEERIELLRQARDAMCSAVIGEKLRQLNLENFSPLLRQIGASFVTLTNCGELRGCIGSLEATLPLVEDVRIHATSAALEDYRFPPVRPEELTSILIEISRLTPMQPIEYSSVGELLCRLNPGIDGVVLVDGVRRGTFLPQVWEKVPETEIFLSMLCRKIGLPGDSWRTRELKVYTYQVDVFHEIKGNENGKPG